MSICSQCDVFRNVSHVVNMDISDAFACQPEYVSGEISAHCSDTHTHTHPFNGPFFGTTQVSRYQKGKTNLDFTEARDSEWQWQWHQLGHMQVCTLLQTDNHASTPPLECPSCRLTYSVKALKADTCSDTYFYNPRCAPAS